MEHGRDHHAGRDDGKHVGKQDLPGQEQRKMPQHPEDAEDRCRREPAEPAFQPAEGEAAESRLLPGAAEARHQQHHQHGDRNTGPQTDLRRIRARAQGDIGEHRRAGDQQRHSDGDQVGPDRCRPLHHAAQ
jgi:hypothetical protein